MGKLIFYIIGFILMPLTLVSCIDVNHDDFRAESINGDGLIIRYTSSCTAQVTDFEDRDSYLDRSVNLQCQNLDCENEPFSVSIDVATKPSIVAFEDACKKKPLACLNSSYEISDMSDCKTEDVVCIFGEWTNSEEYKIQKEAFDNGNDINGYSYIKIGDLGYLTHDISVPESAIYVREYITYFEDIRLEVRKEYSMNYTINKDQINICEDELNEFLVESIRFVDNS